MAGSVSWPDSPCMPASRCGWMSARSSNVCAVTSAAACFDLYVFLLSGCCRNRRQPSYTPSYLRRKRRETTPGNTSGRTFSWDGGSRGCPGVFERFQRIMKQWVGNAHGHQSVRRVWEKRVGRFGFRDGNFLEIRAAAGDRRALITRDQFWLSLLPAASKVSLPITGGGPSCQATAYCSGSIDPDTRRGGNTDLIEESY